MAFHYPDETGEIHGYFPDLQKNGEFRSLGRGWMHAVRLFTENLYSCLRQEFNCPTGNINKQKNSFSSLKLISFSPTFGAMEIAEKYQKANKWNIEKWIDYGNIHVYDFVKHNPEEVASDYIKKARNTIFPTKPLMVTETGYSVGNPENLMTVPTENIRGRYILRSLLELYRLGVKRTFIFNLIGFGRQENLFSLIDSSDEKVPKYKRKSSFYAVKNLISLLGGGKNNFNPGQLKIEFNGDLSNIRKDLVFQKSDGRYYLILWLAQPYNAPNLQRSLSLKINKPSFVEAKLYQPINNGIHPIQIIKNFSAFRRITVSDNPLIVELIPRFTPPK
jgi:hypothetical protein